MHVHLFLKLQATQPTELTLVGSRYVEIGAVVERREEGLVGNPCIVQPVPELERHAVAEHELDEGARGRDVHRALGETHPGGRRLSHALLSRGETVVHELSPLNVPPAEVNCLFANNSEIELLRKESYFARASQELGEIHRGSSGVKTKHRLLGFCKRNTRIISAS